MIQGTLSCAEGDECNDTQKAISCSERERERERKERRRHSAQCTERERRHGESTVRVAEAKSGKGLPSVSG